MNTGRNDPCPCGSGKKFKKCCLEKGHQTDLMLPVARLAALQMPTRSSGVPAEKRDPAQRRRPRTPLELKWDAIWDEFKSKQGEAREAVFLRSLDDNELTHDEAVFEMMNELHAGAVARGERDRFGRMVEKLAERRPDLYQQSAHFYLLWQMIDALADGRPDVPSLARALAGTAGENIDIVGRGRDALAYHGQLTPLVEVMRIGWPLVRDSSDIMGWAINEFSEAGGALEMYLHLESASSPDPSNGELLERIRFFVEDPRLEHVAEFIGNVSGKPDGTWMVADFVLSPPKKHLDRGEWGDDDDDEKENETPVDPGSRNLFSLITQFVGYQRRVDQVPYPRGELIRHALHSYFIERHRGDLNPRLGLLDQAFQPKKKLPPPPPTPSHPLCPEPVTFEVYLAPMFGFMSAQHHKAAALFEVIPAWLRFLQSKKLIDDEQRARTLEEFRPLHASVLKLMEGHTEDPSLHRSLKGWPDDRRIAQSGIGGAGA